METQEVLYKLKQILVEVGELDIKSEQLDENNKNLFEEYNFNSILALEFLLKIEENFNIEIDDEDLDSKLLNDLSYLAEYVRNMCENG